MLCFMSYCRLDMYGRSYQYLIMATYSSHWWTLTNDTDCTEEEILTALECAILVDLLPLSTSGDITISGLVSFTIFTFFDITLSYNWEE